MFLDPDTNMMEHHLNNGFDQGEEMTFTFFQPPLQNSKYDKNFNNYNLKMSEISEENSEVYPVS